MDALFGQRILNVFEFEMANNGFNFLHSTSPGIMTIMNKQDRLCETSHSRLNLSLPASIP